MSVPPGDSTSRPATGSRPPNVVLVVLDTARKASVTPETMPMLCRLADAGTSFERAYATAPWTVPSHASLFTGTETATHGTHGGNPFLDVEFRTLAEAFRDAGYDTTGVSNNTWITEEFGFDRGFDTLRRGWQYLQSDVDMGTVVRGEDRREKLIATRHRLFEGNPLVNLANVCYSEFLQPAGDDGAARTTSWLSDWLEHQDDRPFFLFCNYIEPHIPYDPPRAFAEAFLPDGWTVDEALALRQDPRAYDCEDYQLSPAEFAALEGLYRGELAYVDRHLRELCQALSVTGHWDDTILVVCGDHGENIGDHGFFGHQYTLYGTVLHVPLVFYGGPFTGGVRRSDLVSLLDLPTTLLEVAGIDDPTFARQQEGQSMLEVDARTSRDAVFAEYVSPQPSIERLEARFGTLPEHVYRYDRRLRTIRTDRFAYVCGDDGFERLHDLETDPDELVDVSEDEPEHARRLRRRLESHFGPFETLERAAPEREMRPGTKDRLASLGYL